MHSIANTNKLYVLHSPPCKMLIFACPEGIKIHQKSSYNHIKIHCENYIHKRYQNISKNFSKRPPKPSEIGGVELGKIELQRKQSPHKASKTIFNLKMTQKNFQTVPWKTQNRSEISLQVIKLDKSSCSHNYGSISKRLGQLPQLWDSKNNELYTVL